MKKTLVILIGVIIVLGLLIGVYILFTLFTAPKNTQTVPPPVVSFPTASSSIPSQSQGAVDISVATTKGESMVVRDFIHDGMTTQDVQNPSLYYLAGSVGYCLDDGTCPSGAPSDTYSVVYDETNRSFIISINDEPIGEVRAAASKYLLDALGVTTAQACQVNVQVYTPADVNETFAGQNLGLSFCPGSVRLP